VTSSCSDLLPGLRMTQFVADSPPDIQSVPPWPLWVLLDVGVPFTHLIDTYEGILLGEDKGLMGSVEEHTR